MRAIEISQPGGPEVLRLCERPMPQAGAGEVLLRVRAFGVNRPDALQRRGLYPPPAGAPDLPGLEVCGEIVSGDLAGTDLHQGDLVCALVAGGGYAEYCVAPTGQCLPLPDGLSAEEGAALPETAFTVWHNVFERGRLQAGEMLLVQGGSSGIGTMAIQLAVASGARVVATAGSDEKCAACLQLGAELAINYRTQDFVEAVQAHTAERGADVILDMVAGSYLAREQRCLAEEGRLVVIAVQGGVKAEIDAGLLMRRRQTLTGSTLRARSVAFKSAVAQALHKTVWPWIEQGRVRPVIDAVFPAEDIVQAHQRMEQGQHIGKLVLRWS
ncbi:MULTISPECIES: NAD(P)H-quinone oxidoreductase [unclassified Thiomonas]|jgi:putative PIG3 family NAD(P)H quinone oxidoreductase|uniref:NAD(P)H-quinone oxidoreductase n=1 Tax=unclassified Thiomonas TaxID=2625466 RepID=UPI0004DBA097|nr:MULTISPECIES: NAD(P)H-quinone oxidoreductase [unclassified Thiomonas]MDD5000493.1 NAD(P)H-quinone oxidoreductase [Thiomonas arsenitoxydans]CQR45431.1 putative quinone oxidoreductase [Thiomonas sp. CB3]CDW93083.1 putative quinone oxidoreductase [Thiomonas sp. CB2]VDY06397.1 putative quinone oxidoreductase [Thiomonas sp. Bio17B3]VDY10307.1 putative quinone oxidoreductase [Thiomonas sp. Sup16B3]